MGLGAAKVVSWVHWAADKVYALCEQPSGTCEYFFYLLRVGSYSWSLVWGRDPN